MIIKIPEGKRTMIRLESVSSIDYQLFKYSE